MTSDNVQNFRQTDLKQKEMGKFSCSSEKFRERDKFNQFPSSADQKTTKRLKSPKKYHEGKKSIKETKIEDVFLNSEYFKHQSNNFSSLSFCSGDNGENRWTIDSSFEIPSRQKNLKKHSHSESAFKNSSNFPSESREKSNSAKTRKAENYFGSVKENPDGEKENFLEGIFTEKGRVDQDLITLITEQMFLAEKELQITRTHLIETISKLNERDLEIIKLHEKLQNFQKMENNSSGSNDSTGKNKTSEDYQRLVLASEKLKKQVKDMEDFLNDYGLVWVGDKPDFDKIIKGFQRLNAVASQPKIIQTTLGAKFELPRELPVVLHSNGILLRGKDFREYDKMSTHLFLQDIEDGYFPSELQTEYPEGVPFEVVDKRNEFYSRNSGFRTFNGKGNRLGSSFEDKPASMVFLEPAKESKPQNLSAIANYDPFDKCLLKKNLKNRAKGNFFQDERVKNYFASRRIHSNTFGEKEDAADKSQPETEDGGKSLTLKIRFGKEKTESFVLNIMENDKLLRFQDVLNRKLCQMHHDECLLDYAETAASRTDYEIHVYGKPPFRLIDNLHRRLKDFGIVENCVVNVTEI